MYSIKLYIDIVILIKFASSAKVSLISVLQFLNAAQFLDPTAITPVTKIHASEESQGLYSNELVKNLIGFSCE